MACREEFCRTARVLGEGAIRKLQNARVAVFGIGGVGGYVCEALARAGVGALDLFDSDAVSRSNLNRQIIALQSTVGRSKTEVMRERIIDINPDCRVTVQNVFYAPENADEFPLEGYDFVADAIDSVKSKVELICRATEAGVPIISSMGTGNKLDPSRLRVTDLSKTEGDPLARVMRRELRARGITHLSVVWSSEAPAEAPEDAPEIEGDAHKRTPPGSLPFVPPVAGLLMASEIVRGLTEKREK
jgi:tRNA A37 threonylcarbamoyladenosine dehydratase